MKNLDPQNDQRSNETERIHNLHHIDYIKAWNNMGDDQICYTNVHIWIVMIPFFLSWATLRLVLCKRPSERYPESWGWWWWSTAATAWLLWSAQHAARFPMLRLFFMESSCTLSTMVTPNSFKQTPLPLASLLLLQVLALCPLCPQCEHFRADSFTIENYKSMMSHRNDFLCRHWSKNMKSLFFCFFPKYFSFSICVWREVSLAYLYASGLIYYTTRTPKFFQYLIKKKKFPAKIFV